MNSTSGLSGPLDGTLLASPLEGEVDSSACALLGTVSWVTQGVMGCVVLLTLLLKRYRERPRRPWRIWCLDVSKQCLGQLVVHAVNLFSSDLISASETLNPCSLYLLHVLIDTTLGVLFVAACIRLSQHVLVERMGLEDYASGHYGEDPRKPDLNAFGKQLGVYLGALTLMKALVLLVFALIPSIFKLGDFLLSWLTFSPDAQVLFVVAVFPATMTTIQFLIIDSLIKGKPDTEGYLPPATGLPDRGQSEDRQHLLFEEGPMTMGSPTRQRPPADYPPDTLRAVP